MLFHSNTAQSYTILLLALWQPLWSWVPLHTILLQTWVSCLYWSILFSMCISVLYRGGHSFGPFFWLTEGSTWHYINIRHKRYYGKLQRENMETWPPAPMMHYTRSADMTNTVNRSGLFWAIAVKPVTEKTSEKNHYFSSFIKQDSVSFYFFIPSFLNKFSLWRLKKNKTSFQIPSLDQTSLGFDVNGA